MICQADSEYAAVAYDRLRKFRRLSEYVCVRIH